MQKRLLIGLVIMVGVLALSATIATIIFGERSFEGIVVDKPYETGLAWDKTQRQHQQLGWSAAVQGGPFRTGTNELVVSISDRSGSTIRDAVVDITLTRPATRAYDRTVRAKQQAAGTYHAVVDLPLFGKWDAIISVLKNGIEESIPATLYAGQAERSEQSSCNIQTGPCTVAAADGTGIEFDILPKPVRPMAELAFSVSFPEDGSGRITSVDLDLTMPGMVMGSNRPALTRTAPGRFQGMGIIVRCPTGNRRWQANITLHRQSTVTTAAVVFEVK